MKGDHPKANKSGFFRAINLTSLIPLERIVDRYLLKGTLATNGSYVQALVLVTGRFLNAVCDRMQVTCRIIQKLLRRD